MGRYTNLRTFSTCVSHTAHVIDIGWTSVCPSVRQNQNLYLAFMDLTKAFDTVNRELLWNVLTKAGCPPKFINILKAFHNGMFARVKVGGLLLESI